MKLSPNASVFCNTPWYEAHIYWDGSLGICCQESRKLSDDPKYNIRNMSLTEWFNSDPVRQFRSSVLQQTPTDICSACYYEEEHNGSSRRFRANQKSVIFTKTAFAESFSQSPGYDYFKFSSDTDGLTQTMPIDLHIDLGNHCNLACKMCCPSASTSIATQYVKWGIEEAKTYLGVDWTKDDAVWDRFLNDLLTIPKLKNIHFMGGETLLSPRLEELVDWMIAHQKFDVNFSFVTNGTVYKPDLIEKLKQFPRVGIEISIESTTLHNDYTRQGSNVDQIIENIKLYKQLCLGSDVSVTIRPAISALSIGNYHTLLEFCLDEKLLIKNTIVTNPLYLDVRVLPKSIRLNYITFYKNLIARLDNIEVDSDYNESDIKNYQQSVKRQAMLSIELLSAESGDFSNRIAELVDWCKKWDQVKNFNARLLYPELEELFKKYGY